MYAWYQRKKKQALGIAIAAAAGAAVAYYAYSWYTTPAVSEQVGTNEQDQEDPLQRSPNSTAYTERSRVSRGDTKSSTAGALDLEARIREHQALLQSIANQQSLPEAYHRLHQRLLEYSGVDRLTAGLRALRPSAPPATSSTPSAFPATSAEHAERMARKLAMWDDLRDQSFLLLAATTWLLPALTLLVHVQMTIIGRSAYLEHLVHAPSGVTSPQLGPQSSILTPALAGVAVKRLRNTEQEAFLSHGSFLLQHGLELVLPAFQDTVKRHVGGLALQERISLSSLWQILSQIHEEVDGSVHADAWRAALLPPLVPQPTPYSSPPAWPGGPEGDSVIPAEAAGPSGGREDLGGRGAGPMQPVDLAVASEFQLDGLDGEGSRVVAKLVLEAQEILSSDFFMGAFHSSVKWCAAAMAEALQDHFDGAPRSHVPAGGQYGADRHQQDLIKAQHSPQESSYADEASMVTAAVLPRLAKVADELFTSSNMAEELCRLPAVRALLDATFASGPFLNGPVTDT
eukprot:jgi/Ulvmu1/10238/UM060_0039.1